MTLLADLRDFGGNRLNLSGSIVTASIERDSTTRIVSPKTILRSSSTVSKIVHFRVNKKEYLFVANMFNGVSYNIGQPYLTLLICKRIPVKLQIYVEIIELNFSIDHGHGCVAQQNTI